MIIMRSWYCNPFIINDLAHCAYCTWLYAIHYVYIYMLIAGRYILARIALGGRYVRTCIALFGIACLMVNLSLDVKLRPKNNYGKHIVVI